MSLYQKYRPKKFSEIVGQNYVIQTLTNSIKKNRIGHAYLLTGPRGTGKTTIARVFAKSINCLSTIDGQLSHVKTEPCNKCEACKLILENRAIDFIEIDAASHTGVDNIRNLKKTVALPPSILQYKIYIIDEVHMLSTGAFNALLKTLEEPPVHAVFILATTELHKVPETIISRCQRFDISPLSLNQIVKRLSQIAKKEKVKIDPVALEIIALEAEGGMRDAESLLTQIISLEDKKITEKEVQNILGTSPRKLVFEFIQFILQKNQQESLSLVQELQENGINLKNFNQNLLHFIRQLLLIKANPSNDQKTTFFSKEQLIQAKLLINNTSLEQLIKLIELFQKSLKDLQYSPIPQLPLELAIVELTLAKDSKKNTQSLQIPSDLKPTTTEKNEKKKNLSAPKTKLNKTASLSKKDPEKKMSFQKPKKSNIKIEKILDAWSDILEQIKPVNHSVHAFLQNCSPHGISDNKLFVKTKYSFYKDKLSELTNRLTVQEAIAKIIKLPLQINFITEKEATNMKFSEKKSKSHNVLHDAMQKMGGRIIKS